MNSSSRKISGQKETAKTNEIIKISIDKEMEDKIHAIRRRGSSFDVYTDYIFGKGRVVVLEEVKA